MFFGGLFAAYFSLRANAAQWPPINPETGEPFQLAILPFVGPATILLILSSVTCQIAVWGIRRDDRTAFIRAHDRHGRPRHRLPADAADRLRAARRGGPDPLVRDVRHDLLHADRLPRRARLRRRDHARRWCSIAAWPASSAGSTTTRSRRPRCTGTSSTSSGSCCSRCSTCCPARPRPPRSRSPCIRSAIPATRPSSGSSSWSSAFVYWAVPYFGGWHVDYAGHDHADLPRRGDGADGLRPRRRVDGRVIRTASRRRADLSRPDRCSNASGPASSS